jgi:hypothetical protein
MNPDDLVRCLKQADPVDDESLDGWEQSDQARRILDGVLDTDRASVSSPRAPRLRSRRRVVGVALGVALLAATIGAAYALISRPTANPLSVGCYERLDQDADTAVFRIERADESLGAVGICAREWQGAFGEPAPANLVTCVVDGGGTGVFPIPPGLAPEEACASIHASLPAVGGTPYGGLSAEQVRALAWDLEARYEALAETPECAGVVDLEAAARASLDNLGAPAWSVEDLTSATQEWTFADGRTQTVNVRETTDGQTCSGYAIDALRAKVILVNAWPQAPVESP